MNGSYIQVVDCITDNQYSSAFTSLGSACLKDLRLLPIGPSSKSASTTYFIAYLTCQHTPGYEYLTVDNDRLSYQAHDIPAK